MAIKMNVVKKEREKEKEKGNENRSSLLLWGPLLVAPYFSGDFSAF
jgi:hypothetical protein